MLGYLTVLRWHIIVGDSVSRLAHAYFVWFNKPPKLAAIGFVWPPLMTIVLLPVSAIKPLATSLLALPLMSGLFAAALVVTVDRTLALLGLSRGARLPLVALVGLNPMVLYYAANGMGETLYLFLLTLAVYGFIRWYLRPDAQSLALTSMGLALGLLARYELIFWAAALALAVTAVLLRRGASRVVVEGTAIAFLAPVVYGFGLWIFFNWLILGDPLHWLHSEVTLTFEETRAQLAVPERLDLSSSATQTLGLTWHLFPATLVTVGLLLLAFLWRRDFLALVLATMIALNPLSTALLAVATQSDVTLQLRYNLRPVPIAVIGLAWLCRSAPARARMPALLAAFALLAGSLPSMWGTMETYRRQALEQAFTRALLHGTDQEGTRSLGSGVPVGSAPEHAAAAWVTAHVDRKSSVLADDEESFSVMLYSGRPDLFFDRIDEGDSIWLETLGNPFGKVDYVLVSRSRPDLVRQHYPKVLEGGIRWLRPAFSNARWTIFRIVPRSRPG